MSNRVMYCFRNKVKDSEKTIRNTLREYHADSEMIPTYCMKLCFLCPNRLVTVANGELIVTNDEEELISRIEQSCKNHSSV